MAQHHHEGPAAHHHGPALVGLAAALNGPSGSSSWLNLGLWPRRRRARRPRRRRRGCAGTPGNAYPQAAAALADAVFDAALLRPGGGGTVADVGCGTGDAALRLVAAGRAARCVGVNLSAAELAVAEARRTAGGPSSAVEFRRGDAARLAEDVARPGERFRAVVAIDCAYVASTATTTTTLHYYYYYFSLTHSPRLS